MLIFYYLYTIKFLFILKYLSNIIGWINKWALCKDCNNKALQSGRININKDQKWKPIINKNQKSLKL